jgi:ribosomal protein L7/L12
VKQCSPLKMPGTSPWCAGRGQRSGDLFGGDSIPEEVIALACAGKTLKAIKAYRNVNGATLEEAQAVIRGIC